MTIRTTLFFSALLLSGCGGGGSAPAPTAADAQGALRAALPGEIASYFQARIAARSAQGLEGIEIVAVTPAVVTASAGAALDAAPSFSGTTLQEAGVDEDDLLKTDGSFVYALNPAYYSGTSGSMTAATLAASRIQADGSLTTVGTATLTTSATPSGIYLADSARRIAVVGQDWGRGGDYFPTAQMLLPYSFHPTLSLDTFDVSDGGRPVAGQQLVIDGRLVASRMIGNVLYLASSWTPDLSIYRVPAGTPTAQAQTAVAGLKTSELLPTIRVNGGSAQPLVSESDCLVQPANASLSLQLTTLTAIDLGTPNLERHSRCFIGDASALYMSPRNVYLASSRNYWIGAVNAMTVLPPQASTDIHKFAMDGLQVTYRGSGEVTGHLGWDAEKAPYRMSEHEGDLRVLTFTGETGWGGPIFTTTTTTTTTPLARPSPATLTVLRESAQSHGLAAVATLPNAQRPAPLGREGEQVFGVRFAGPLAYVVTFHRTDPLYVLDLSNPVDPKTAGELAVAGFSDYLFPLANGTLLGVGKDATAEGLTQGVKVSLFDVSNPARPRELASQSLGERGSSSALDYSRHGINIFQQGPQVRVALPVRLTASGTSVMQQGLARFTVDTAAGTLSRRPLIASTQLDPYGFEDWGRYDLSNERSVQTERATYYLSGGQVTFFAEP